MTEISDADLKGALAAVTYGHDPVAALNLITYFYQRIDNNSPFNEQILFDFIHHAFGKIVNDGVSADHAFGFKQRRGKHARKDTFERDVVAAAIVTLNMRNGMTWLEAKGDAANKLFPDGHGEKAVEAAYTQYRDTFNTLPDATLKSVIN